MIIFKASGVRMTDISTAILNLEEHCFRNSEKDFQCRVHTPVNYQSNLEDLKKFISRVLPSQELLEDVSPARYQKQRKRKIRVYKTGDAA